MFNRKENREVDYAMSTPAPKWPLCAGRGKEDQEKVMAAQEEAIRNLRRRLEAERRTSLRAVAILSEKVEAFRKEHREMADDVRSLVVLAEKLDRDVGRMREQNAHLRRELKEHRKRMKNDERWDLFSPASSFLFLWTDFGGFFFQYILMLPSPPLPSILPGTWIPHRRKAISRKREEMTGWERA